MRECADFQEEKSAMEVLLDGLNAKSGNNQSIKLLVPQKYHCELTGEGVEYVWGMTKRFYQSCALGKKNTKHKFNRVVRAAVEHVSKENVEKFLAQWQRYMMAYLHLSKGDGFTHAMIKRFVKVSKTHRNIGDQEKGFIQKVILESVSL